jgi:hypothetical protein
VVIETIKTEGVVVVPGIVKLRAVDKPATPERQGVDPFTKQPKTFAAKPASKKVKASPLKNIKDAVRRLHEAPHDRDRVGCVALLSPTLRATTKISGASLVK